SISPTIIKKRLAVMPHKNQHSGRSLTGNKPHQSQKIGTPTRNNAEQTSIKSGNTHQTTTRKDNEGQ
ncbi:hypothetical protein, partial [Klebsiella pneumoniae]|uniref:hypothetical protein n=1 Tax=Klebsiella pneumoniae TaxID=573 RepID=UPI001D0EE9D2